MFSLLSGLYDEYWAPQQISILIVGATGVGKTTILERTKVTHVPKVRQSPSSSIQQQHAIPFQLQKELGFTEISLPAHELHEKNNGQSIMMKSTKQQQQKDDAKAQQPPPKLPLPPPPSPSSVTNKQPQRRFPFACPAPKRYQKSQQDQDQDEEFVYDDDDNNNDEEKQPLHSKKNITNDNVDKNDDNANMDESTKSFPSRSRLHSRELSMEDVTLTCDDYDNHNHNNNKNVAKSDCKQQGAQKQESDSANQPLGTTPQYPSLYQTNDIEYDIKPHTKMLPLHKIRPTIGTNLAKLDMCGTKCHMFDVGGKMQSLWERYYEDCDAVIFVLKVGETNDNDVNKKADDNNNNNNDNDNGDDDDVSKVTTMQEQLQLLSQVRNSISDDIPFLIFGHVFGGNCNEYYTKQMYTTEHILPHYHNPITTLAFGSGITGVGIVHALQWLIPLAKRQQIERQQSLAPQKMAP